MDDFKLAMRIIATIQSTNISTELQLHEIQETFAILADHKIEVMNLFSGWCGHGRVHSLPFHKKVHGKTLRVNESHSARCKIKRFIALE